MKAVIWVWVLVAGVFLAACGIVGTTNDEVEVPTPITPAAGITSEPSPEPSIPPVDTRAGSEYVLLLPREAAVPADWVMNPAPSFENRQPQPGDTYRFACSALTSRSVGAAAVGYRHLEGLPSIYVEYVIYPTADMAAAALAEMQTAVEDCPTFTIGEGEGATSAAFSSLEFPPYGDTSFAALLATDSPVTGELHTHMHKILAGHVVIGVNHAAYADQAPPDKALTESIVALAVGNLAGGPNAPGD